MLDGWRTDKAKEVTETEDKLFDLEGQLVLLAQTMPHCLEEECMLVTLQRREEKLMRWTKKLQRKIAKAQQGESTLESNTKWEITEERALPTLPSPFQAMAPTIITMKLDTVALLASLGKDVSMSPKSGELPEEGSSATTSNELVAAMGTT